MRPHPCLLQGYLPQQLYNLTSKYGTKEQLQHLTWDLNHAGIKPIAGKCRGTVVASPGHTLVMLLLPLLQQGFAEGFCSPLCHVRTLGCPSGPG